jgi:TetR/AcrR family transcriptional regulator
MSDHTTLPADEVKALASSDAGTQPRKRPKPGERRIQILKTLAAMLEQPGVDRITTAALASKLEVSEAALYRHFASKAQMFEGLIEFIEQNVFALITSDSDSSKEKDQMPTHKIVTAVLQFCEKNPGMCRVMAGDALVFEHERLMVRMNQLFERLETQLRQSMRASSTEMSGGSNGADASVKASLLAAFMSGRMHRFVRSGFKRLPTEHLDAALKIMA